VISNTAFTIEEPRFIGHACANLRPGIATASEIRELEAKCAAEQVMCVACEDGMLVFDLRYHGDALELFVWLGVAFRHGAYERQDAELDHIAFDLGASQIAFQSRRRGWGRRLRPAWHRRGSDEFVRATR
jgi:hypothetical protein